MRKILPSSCRGDVPRCCTEPSFKTSRLFRRFDNRRMMFGPRHHQKPGYTRERSPERYLTMRMALYREADGRWLPRLGSPWRKWRHGNRMC